MAHVLSCSVMHALLQPCLSLADSWHHLYCVSLPSLLTMDPMMPLPLSVLSSARGSPRLHIFTCSGSHARILFWSMSSTSPFLWLPISYSPFTLTSRLINTIAGTPHHAKVLCLLPPDPFPSGFVVTFFIIWSLLSPLKTQLKLHHSCSLL